MKRSWKLAGTLAILLLAALGAAWIRACSDPAPALVFNWDLNPELPLDPFAAGRLGALQPCFARSYLVVAYRHLMGRPLSGTEQEEVLDLWSRRLGSGANYLDTPPPEGQGESPEAQEDWVRARATRLREPLPPIQRETVATGPELKWRTNIQEGAFGNAVQTLLDRERRWGKGNARLKAWIRAQDQVFSAHPGQSGHPGQPTLSALPASADPLLRADRAYQIASARFYGQDLEGALLGYRAISQDPGSPWRGTAAYMLARTCYRKGLLLEESAPAQARQAFQEALAQANACAGHPDANAFAQRLRWDLKGRKLTAAQDADSFELPAYFLAKAAAAEADPPQRTRDLAAQLARSDGSPDFGIDLGDYTILLDRQIHGESQACDLTRRCPLPSEEPERNPRSLAPELLQDDLTDWVFSFRNGGHAAYRHAFERWSKLGTAPWLLSALANASAEEQGVPALLAAAARLAPGHPGYPMAALHLARLQLARRQPEQARATLDRLLAQGPQLLPAATANQAKTLRLALARSPESLLLDLQRSPVGVRDFWTEGPPEDGTGAGRDPRLLLGYLYGYGMDRIEVRSYLEAYPPRPSFLQEDGADLLNHQLPIERLIQLARMPGTAPHLRREWLRCAWVRAVLLGRLELAGTLAPELRQLEPRLEAPLAAFEQVPPDQRDREALWILLRHPGLTWTVRAAVDARTLLAKPGKASGSSNRGLELTSRDPQRDSWWSGQPGPAPAAGPDASPEAGPHPASYLDAGLEWMLGHGQAQAPAFLSPRERRSLAREQKALQALDNGPAWLCARTARWAQEAPRDPRLPEALHDAVRSSRVDTAGPAARTCFRILHDRFPTSKWTAWTPYYF